MDISLLIIIILPLLASLYVNISYKKNLKKESSKGMTGFDVARTILDANGLNDVLILETRGTLTDHYDPNRKVVKLSHDVYNGTSISSNAVAAHEVGHAIQDKEGYIFLRIRSFIFPLVNFVSRFSYYIIILGIFLELMELVWVGIIAVALGLLFQIITLPVEFNASSRAKEELSKLNISNSEDNSGISNMLTAAALTYVAGVLAGILQLLRLIGIARDN